MNRILRPIPGGAYRGNYFERQGFKGMDSGVLAEMLEYARERYAVNFVVPSHDQTGALP
jgi:hypothetical protein